MIKRTKHMSMSHRPRLSKNKRLSRRNIFSRKIDDNLKFVELGGLEEIGRNCSYFEYKDEIVIIDVGVQFPEEETPGIDFIIPNISSLEPKKKNIKAIVLTHGHYDHIHALPYVLEKLGNPIIYTAKLTKELVAKRFEEFPNLPKPKFEVMGDGDKVRISENFNMEFFEVDHTIPDSMGLILDTPAGKMVHFGDFRLKRDIDGNVVDIKTYERLSKMDIHSIFIDSTSADVKGQSKSEELVEKNLKDLFENAKGRIIVATFASLLTRIATMMKLAEKMGRKVAVNGRSMKDNVQIAKNLGYIKFPKDHIISMEEIHKYKDNEIVILTTGAQGESTAGLMRITKGEHRSVKLKSTDTVILSSSIVPGNERSVQSLLDDISRQTEEIYNYRLLDIHTSGHNLSDDIELIIKTVKPKNVIPVYAFHFKRLATAKLARKVGIPNENIFMLDNGQVAEITKEEFKITDKTVPANYVMVDGLGVGDVEEVVLRDRKHLADEGMVVIITTLNRATGKLIKTPDIISRGFIYLKENKELLDDVRAKIRQILPRIPRKQQPDPDYVKSIIRDQIGKLLYNKTKRRPMVLPVLIEV